MKKDASVILLADDDVDDAEMFTSIWEEVDPAATVLTFSTGALIIDHLAKANQRQPDVIFLDINMPEMNGWQCLKAIKSNPRVKHIPVIMYSTSSHQRDKELAAELGAIAFVTKPSDYKTLRETLRAISINLNGDLANAIRRLL
jgi:CheY-like chemotaxis protein